MIEVWKENVMNVVYILKEDKEDGVATYVKLITGKIEIQKKPLNIKRVIF